LESGQDPENPGDGGGFHRLFEDTFVNLGLYFKQRGPLVKAPPPNISEPLPAWGLSFVEFDLVNGASMYDIASYVIKVSK
jgi:hypothetical protein